jgi:putative transposase
LHAQGERVVSTDELTAVQALERKHPSLPLAAGKVERREFEYIRHGTLSFIFSRDVSTGELLAPYCQQTRKEADFLAQRGW